MDDRFWARVNRGSSGECWAWSGARNAKGYGIVRRGGKNRRATHIALEQDDRPLRTGEIALHLCDHPWCVNPAHLRAGTVAENQAQMSERDRSAFGSRNPGALLDEEKVRQIRAARAGGESTVSLARRFGVSRGTISAAARGVSWGRVK